MTEPDAHRDAEAAGAPASLTAAKTLVVAQIDQLEGEGRISSDVANSLRAWTQTAQTLFALDDEVVFQQSSLKKRFCVWPECFRPPKPAEQPGRPPAYCADGKDDEGRLHCGDDMPEGQSDHAQRARRLRLAKRRGVAVAAGREAKVDPAGDRPVSVARQTVSSQVREVIAEVRRLTVRVEELKVTAELTADEEARVAEIEAIQVEAQSQVDEEKRLRLAAEEVQRKLQRAHDRMASDLEDANAAAEEAAEEVVTARLAQDRAVAERDIAHREARSKVAAAHALTLWLSYAARQLATWLAAEAQWKARIAVDAAREELAAGLSAAAGREQATRQRAEEEIAAAKAEFEDKLANRTADMTEKVRAADAARDAALAQAADRERAAAQEVAAAGQSVIDAEAARDEAKGEVAQLRAESTRLREAALRREEQHGQATAQLVDTHRQETETLHRRLDDERQHHQDELDRVRAEARSDYDRQLALVERAYKAENESLQQTVQRLTDAARRDDADSADADEPPAST